MKKVLVLNGSYQPIRTISWRHAVTLWYLGKAEVLSHYADQLLRAPRLTIKMPSVIRLKNYFKGVDHLMLSSAPFSRRNIFGRDSGICQYCGKKLSLEEMTIDHVVPKMLGGKREWTNIVACCSSCNRYKADRTPKQAGMTLRKKPAKPTAWALFIHTDAMTAPQSWNLYLGRKK